MFGAASIQAAYDVTPFIKLVDTCILFMNPTTDFSFSGLFK